MSFKSFMIFILLVSYNGKEEDGSVDWTGCRNVKLRQTVKIISKFERGLGGGGLNNKHFNISMQKKHYTTAIYIW